MTPRLTSAAWWTAYANTPGNLARKVQIGLGPTDVYLGRDGLIDDAMTTADNHLRNAQETIEASERQGEDHVNPDACRWFRWRIQREGTTALSAKVYPWQYVWGETVRIPSIVFPGESFQSEPIDCPPREWLRAEADRAARVEAEAAAYRGAVQEAFKRATS